MSANGDSLLQQRQGLDVLSDVAIAAAGIVGPTLMWSGLAKARTPTSAALALVRFGLLSGPNLGAARGLALLEVGLGLTVVITLGHSTALLVCALMFGAFTAAILFAVRAHRAFSCSCFGGAAPVTRWTALRAAALAITSLLGSVARTNDAGFFADGNRASDMSLFAATSALLAACIVAHALYRYRPFSSVIPQASLPPSFS